VSLVAAACAGENPVMLVTEVALATAAIASALTPIALARRRKRKEELDKAAAAAVNTSDLTLAGWTALNSALQHEISRLQGVTERMQKRIDQLEREIAELQKLAFGDRTGAP
jgi:predicted RNase H-like nuclease (RuvC/YqgF family)